jgi:hypothetical protein
MLLYRLPQYHLKVHRDSNCTEDDETCPSTLNTLRVPGPAVEGVPFCCSLTRPCEVDLDDHVNRCEDLIEKAELRVGQEVHNPYAPEQQAIQWFHFGCLKPEQLARMGVNANGFHSIACVPTYRRTSL